MGVDGEEVGARGSAHDIFLFLFLISLILLLNHYYYYYYYYHYHYLIIIVIIIVIIGKEDVVGVDGGEAGAGETAPLFNTLS
jgi:hypothetical protein